MNRGELRTSLQDRGFGADTAATQDRWLIEGYQRTSGHRRWSWLLIPVDVVVPISTNTWSTASLANYSSLASIQLADPLNAGAWLELERQSRREWLEYRGFEDNDELGTPHYWTLVGENVVFTPVTDREYTMAVLYWQNGGTVDLADDADVPLLPVTHHSILVDYAEHRAARRQRDWNTADRALQSWKDGLLDLVQQDASQRAGGAHVRSSGFFDPFEVV